MAFRLSVRERSGAVHWYSDPEALRPLIRADPRWVVTQLMGQLPPSAVLQLFESAFEAGSLAPSRAADEARLEIAAALETASARQDTLTWSTAPTIDPELRRALELDVRAPVARLRSQLEADGAFADLVEQVTAEGEGYLAAAIDEAGIRDAVGRALTQVGETLANAKKNDPAAVEELTVGLARGTYFFNDTGALRIDRNRLLSRAMFDRYGLSVMSDGRISGSSSPLWFAIERLKGRRLTEAQRGELANEVLSKFAGQGLTLTTQGAAEAIDRFLAPMIEARERG